MIPMTLSIAKTLQPAKTPTTPTTLQLGARALDRHDLAATSPTITSGLDPP